MCAYTCISYMQEIAGNMFLPNRVAEGPLIYAVDHCFGIKGQGTIMTGTILSGKISLNDVSFIPYILTYVCLLIVWAPQMLKHVGQA